MSERVDVVAKAREWIDSLEDRPHPKALKAFDNLYAEVERLQARVQELENAHGVESVRLEHTNDDMHFEQQGEPNE